jgi:hypothetical protein
MKSILTAGNALATNVTLGLVSIYLEMSPSLRAPGQRLSCLDLFSGKIFRLEALSLGYRGFDEVGIKLIEKRGSEKKLWKKKF